MVAARRIVAPSRPALARGPAHELLELRWDLAEILRAGTVIAAAVVAAALASLSFRIVAQFMGWTSPAWPLAWIYGLGGLFAQPFRGFETVRPIDPRTAFEFADIVALEVYLLGGIVIMCLLIGLRLAARGWAPRTWSVTFETSAFADRLLAFEVAAVRFSGFAAPALAASAVAARLCLLSAWRMARRTLAAWAASKTWLSLSETSRSFAVRTRHSVKSGWTLARDKLSASRERMLSGR